MSEKLKNYYVPCDKCGCNVLNGEIQKGLFTYTNRCIECLEKYAETDVNYNLLNF